MAEHWYADCDNRVVYDSDEMAVADVRPNHARDITASERANLIAAAPDLLAACKELCKVIKFFGQSKCDFSYDGPSLEFIEENWQDSTLPYLLVAYEAGEAAIAKARGPET